MLRRKVLRPQAEEAGLVLPCIPWRRHRGRHHSWGGGGGGGTAGGARLEIAALGGRGVLASVSRASMMKRTLGADEVFLGALGSGVSKPIAVGALGVAVSLRCFLDFEPF